MELSRQMKCIFSVYLGEQDSVLSIISNGTDTIQRRDFQPITVHCMVQNAFKTALFRAHEQTKHQKKKTLELCQTNFKGKEKLYKLKAAIGVTIINPLDSNFFGSWHFTILELCSTLMPVQQMMISLKHLINSELVKAPAK